MRSPGARLLLAVVIAVSSGCFDGGPRGDRDGPPVGTTVTEKDALALLPTVEEVSLASGGEWLLEERVRSEAGGSSVDMARADFSEWAATGRGRQSVRVTIFDSVENARYNHELFQMQAGDAIEPAAYGDMSFEGAVGSGPWGPGYCTRSTPGLVITAMNVQWVLCGDLNDRLGPIVLARLDGETEPPPAPPQSPDATSTPTKPTRSEISYTVENYWEDAAYVTAGLVDVPRTCSPPDFDRYRLYTGAWHFARCAFEVPEEPIQFRASWTESAGAEASAYIVVTLSPRSDYFAPLVRICPDGSMAIRVGDGAEVVAAEFQPHQGTCA